MSLRHVVPTLGALALTTAAPAIEVGDLTIGGFVDTILVFQDSDGSGSTAGDDSVIDFTADGEIQLGYNIGNNVTAQIDLEVNGESAGTNTNVEQAYVSWQVNDQATLTMGKVETLVGYEAVDSPDQWRVGTSLVDDISPGSTTGLNVGFAPSDQVAVDVYIVDGLYDTDSNATAAGKLSDDLSFGVSVVFTGPEDDFFVDLDFGIDTGGDPTVGEEDVTVFSLNGEFSGVERLTVFGDITQMSTDDSDDLGIMLGANYEIDETKSVTGMLSTVDWDAADATTTEFAVALLTMPTGDANFAINYEIAVYDADDSGIPHAGASSSSSGAPTDDATTFSVEWIAVIP